jgi:abortive infection bacteriophage resistance protein
MPYNTIYPFINKNDLSKVYKNKLFAALCCIQYIIKIISPQSDFKNNLVSIIKDSGKLLNVKDMGFPQGWESFDIWK